MIPGWAKFAAIGGVLAATWWAGWEWRDRSADLEISQINLALSTAREDALRNSRRVERLRQHATDAVNREAALRDEIRKAEARVITKEVIKYVQSPDAGRCQLPDDWVRIHDAAASGGLPGDTGTASEPDGGAVALTDSDALVTVTDNYDTCRAIRDRLIGLQDWARSLITR